MKNHAIIFSFAACLLFAATHAHATDWGSLGKRFLNRALSSEKTQQQPSSSSLNNLATTDVAAAFKQALSIGSSNVISQLGQNNGFLNDPKVHIPLPESLSMVQNSLKVFGMSYLLDDLETRLNKAAEIATPHAKELFLNAISDMNFDDVMKIYNGPQDSATQYFRGKMSSSLAEKMSPYVNNALSEAGAIKSYDQVMGKYKQIPYSPDVKSNLSNYVVDQGINGIFYYLAQQEQAIRQDPVKQTTTLLKTVFGQ